MATFELTEFTLRWWRRFVNETILPSEQEAIDSLFQLLADTEASLQKYEVKNDLIRRNSLERQREDIAREISFISGVNHKTFKFDTLSDSQFERYFELRNNYQATSNSYWLLEAFVWFVGEDISPPSWVLTALGQRLQAHLENPDVDLLSIQLGVQARGSGKTNPYDSYRLRKHRDPALADMANLLLVYEISKLDAARAIVWKYELQVTPKRLASLFNERYGAGDIKELGFNRPNVTENEYAKYVNTFPPKARKFLRKRRSP